MDETEALKEQIKSLEKRVEALERVINGTAPKRPGRKPKLSFEQRIEITRKHASGASYDSLAKEYSVSKTTIHNIFHKYGKSIEDDMVVPVSRS